MGPTDPDIVALGQAVAAMKGRQDALSWERQRAIHDIFVGQHGTWRFLPWHRVQLAHFEAIVAALSGRPDFALPYWDYQATPKLPAWIFEPASPLFVPARDATPAFDVRQYRFTAFREVTDVLRDPLNTFVGGAGNAGTVEGGGHNAIHVAVGGPMGRVSTATLDPLFWMHHCNVDRVWATWHQETPRTYPNAWMAERIEGFVNASGAVAPRTTAGAVRDTASLGYRYDKVYEFPNFNIPVNPPTGKERRETIAVETLRGQALATKDAVALEVALPAAALAAFRAAKDDTVMLEGLGVARFRNPRLHRRAIVITALDAKGGQVDVSLMTTFVHESDHAGHQSTGYGFAFGPELGNLIRGSDGPIRLRMGTEPVDEADTRTPPAADRIAFDLTVTRMRWV